MAFDIKAYAESSQRVKVDDVDYDAFVDATA